MAMAVPVAAFSQEGRENHSIAAELEGGLLISRNPFPYFMLVALEAGGPVRSLILLLVYPFIWFLNSFISEDVALRVTIFVSTAGLKLSDVKAVAKANLPRFYVEDLGKEAYMVFSGCGGEKYVITSIPRVLVEPFLREYMGADCVIGTELRSIGGYCLGLVASQGRMVGDLRLESLRAAAMRCKNQMIDVGLGSGALKQHPFMSLCLEKYVISPEKTSMEPLPRSFYPKPLIFHDGRLVSRPTPSNALVMFLWLPFGVCLAVARLMVVMLLPYKFTFLAAAATGLRIKANFTQDMKMGAIAKGKRNKGTLYVCSHRTLLDPVMISCSLQRSVMAVTYSLSRVSEVLSPIPNFRLTRDRIKDGEMMRSLLEQGDLVVCPEGTTCREPYLLRFSPLFAEVAEEIVPVAVTTEGISMFYGTTVRGHKWLDSFFFLMNPTPCYRLRFLEKVDPKEKYYCRNVDVANHVQRVIGGALGFQCTNFTRRDKYRMIAGNDGMQRS